MALLGQPTGAWTESATSLRVLHPGVKNATGLITDDAFTQSNPPVVSTNVSAKLGADANSIGVLSGSVAISRPDGGSNYIGGAGAAALETAYKAGGGSAATSHGGRAIKVLGVFYNAANGNNGYDNNPAAASGKLMYVSAQGTFGNSLYETALIGAATATHLAGTALVYSAGVELIASRNGYLMPKWHTDGVSLDDVTVGLESAYVNADNSSTIIGICKMAPDSAQNEIVYDQRI